VVLPALLVAVLRAVLFARLAAQLPVVLTVVLTVALTVALTAVLPVALPVVLPVVLPVRCLVHLKLVGWSLQLSAALPAMQLVPPAKVQPVVPPVVPNEAPTAVVYHAVDTAPHIVVHPGRRPPVVHMALLLGGVFVAPPVEGSAAGCTALLHGALFAEQPAQLLEW
jgi:hypothetical protein